MYCPKCGAEYREGFDRCGECDVALTTEPPPDLHSKEENITVLETSDPSLIPVVKSALDGAGIPYFVKGEGMMNLFPSEALGALLHSSAGEVEIRVPASRAEEARALLNADAKIEDDAFADELANSDDAA